ncbi:Gly-Xaa carboxypeptidase, partial [Sarracenia purpurea var. burkii]
VWNVGPKEQRNFYRLQCKAMSKSNNEEYRNVYQNGMRVIKRNEIVKHDREGKAVDEECATKKIKEHVESVRSMLGSMEDGEISVSAYDTAWVAMVPNLDGSGGPQFPSSLRWIAENQLPDGSWGDSSIFEPHDRIINTLACAVALKSWNVHPHKCQKGYFNKNQ